LGDVLVEQIVQVIAENEGLDCNCIQLIKENGLNVENQQRFMRDIFPNLVKRQFVEYVLIEDTQEPDLEFEQTDKLKSAITKVEEIFPFTSLTDIDQLYVPIWVK